MKVWYEDNSKCKKEFKVPLDWLLETRTTRSRSRFTRTLLKYSKLYCKYTKLAGFRYFVDSEATWFDRTLWFLVYAVTVPAMVCTIYYGYLEFMENPLFTSVETEYFPTYKLNFPGIAICSINRISRRSAMELADEIFTANISDLPVDEILNMISQLGDLYDSEFKPQNRFYRIDQLLTVFYNGYYSITDVMKRLTPQCSSMLSKCRFHDEERNCSELFAFRKTQDGFCCTFNYATKGDDTHLNREVSHRVKSMKVQNLTENGGLSVLLEPFLDDYFYPIFPSAGWKVTIFNPYDYPDMTSGGVIDFLVSPRVHRSVELEAIMFYSIRSIMSYALEKRDCVFEDEMTSLRMFYTYSDCIVDCKTQDMWKICKCIPFFLPNRESKRVCNLEDVPCLSQHKSTWFSVVPHENLYNNNENMDKTETLYCHNCYPECSHVKYNAKIAMSGLESNQHVAEVLTDVEIKNQSLLTIYFNNFGTIKLKQDVIYRWYEVMGEASGICGIFVGFSLIVVVEFAYFVGLFVLELLKGPTPTDGKWAESEQTPIQSIYWGELYSYARTTKNQRD
ncbi:sodium channel protein Nach-like [Bombus affinis]|uniref:sodium channel protein Nach-like n=1 Tax=Bombus affinis TaxID=309941 RepID=UPI0021B8466B|nr:sodium channel protein Nach-like [Bombus affinis]